MSRRRGRPSSTTVTLSKPRILAAAKAVLHESGADAVTFRAVADRLQVTPMAITHHTGPRADLMADLVTEIYRPLDAPLTAGTPKDQLRELLPRLSRSISSPRLGCFRGGLRRCSSSFVALQLRWVPLTQIGYPKC